MALNLHRVTAPPAKIKAFLTKIKEEVLDDDAVTPDRLFQGLLQLELSQRSMLVEGHIMDNVEAAAGMTLTEEFPVLSAAASAMAGKVAEALAQSNDRPTYDPKALTRVKQDLRFQAILAKDPEYWILAEGYYRRAASFQPDVPVHWKKAWECLVARRTSHANAAPYVAELLRIAALKKNAKRVETLTLQLVDCYLQQTDDTPVTSIAAKAFLSPQKIATKPVPESERLKTAEDLLAKVVATDDEEAQTYAISLKLRVEMMKSSDDLSKRNRSLIATGEELLKRGVKDYDELLMRYVDLLIETAKQTKGWEDAAHFVTMVVETKSDSNSERMLTHVCLAAPVIEWHQPGVLSLDTFRTIRKVLQQSFATAEAAAAMSMAKRSAILKDMQSALSAIDCWMVLRGDTVQQRSPLAPTCNYAADCGVAYLEFLVAWSGFHRVPWPQTIQSEARSILQRARSAVSTVNDNLLLKLGEADTEGAAFDGGRVDLARKLYQTTLQAAKTELAVTNQKSVLLQLISARCLIGLAEIDERDDTRLVFASDSIQESLSCIEQLEVSDEASLHLWTNPGYLQSCISSLTAQSRQITATILLRRGRPLEAEKVLEDAVNSAPSDASASFGLGSFRLYKALFVQDSTSDELKAAQLQLLKAAKLDSSQADPFALLGIWYEHRSDTKRAAGCYSKALLSNPAHPVAGRGLLRLAPAEALTSTLDTAARTLSTTSGWAWRAIGKKKAMEDGEDELAVIALLKALRCQDIARSKSDLRSPFYKDPRSLSSALHPEQAETLWDLAQCYRRLGRFTASLRTFNFAIESAGDTVKPELLYDCAQVELALGLLDEAEANFCQGIHSLEKASTSSGSLLAYGRAMTLLLMVRRDHQDGKSGAAFRHLLNAIECCNTITDAKMHSSVSKLLGDLYSYGSELPLDLFVSDTNKEERHWLAAKLGLVSTGEDRYRAALELTSDDDARASLMTDIGSNVLSRAHMLEFHESSGLWNKPTEKVNSLYEEASAAFRQAIDISPGLASAWCGLGCSTITIHPLMAQHAFVRALELDIKSPEAYANLSFLYTKFKCFGASTAVSDALTEVADTPAMWINRALVLEDELGNAAAKEQAADAYRAALQVSQTPEALRGLAMTLGQDTNIAEKRYVIEQYLGSLGNADSVAILLHRTQQIGFAATSFSCYSGQIAMDGVAGIERETNNSMTGLDDEHGTRLSIEKFQDLAQRCKDVKVLHVASSLRSRWSLQRQVANNPWDASHWLRLTRDLVAASAVKEAEKTSKRAAKLFETRLRSGSSDACQISEAFCLEQWIRLTQEKKADRTCVKKLQQALLMDPSNKKARRALKEIKQINI